MDRRQALQSLGAALLGGPLAVRARSVEVSPRRKVLLFSRSVLFEHSVIRRDGSRLSFAEAIFVELGKRNGLDVECTKEGSVFEGDLAKYDAFVSYSCGGPSDLAKPESLDRTSPLTPEGRQRLLHAVAAGKGFVAIHPGILLLPEAVGADCIGHGSQQPATMRVTSPDFPGLRSAGRSFTLKEEWFSLYRFARDLHVILVQDCHGMSVESVLDKRCYDRPPFPATWCRMYGKGRVFYTSMGHREDVWTNPIFQQILLGGLHWSLGDASAPIEPNLDRVAPEAEKTRL